MKKEKFAQLLESVRQGGEIIRGERAPSREFTVEATAIKTMRERLQLSQTDLAGLMAVPVSTLQNWEQGRREPTGPAKALLRALDKDPTNVLKALAA